ncbi:progranulin isoform X2 [Varanus komodoensis]|uniref:Granulin precursor n=2 Tax=Varanus komodoensis TaxID=61221 RepID=A0A8D2LMW4_VARKO|nr:progranulin isoform X2 [Varanus komodoensis]XP_044274677.1 progranulin isoform X2 [Varanus komodoensis]
MWARWMVYIVLGGTTSSLKCPNGHTCEGISTCCKLPEGDEYACCNQPQLMRASQGTLYAESSNKIPGVVCPDGTTCPEEYSCVHTEGSSFACCPWKEATSCADKRHCCPSGSYCSADGQLCLQNEVLTSTKFGAVQCPDGESECPNESTCCPMADGSWGCCPLPEASCCSDGIHCCPHGMRCDLVHAQCSAASGKQPLQEKFPARKQAPVASVPQRNICPDNQSSCLETATCCRLPSSHYGCCPLPNAVCCPDHLHCCPQGTTCDLTHSTCIMTLRQLLPITHLPVDVQTTHEVRCDAEHSCPDGNTCCKKASGTWGCCPLPQAVCCTDGRHCCPEGYTCNSSLGICLKPGHSLPWVRKLPASGPQSRGIRCNDTASCKEGQTCCRGVSGDWSCCQLPKAVCCEDHLHCCPSGYTCNVMAQSCEKQPKPKPLDAGALLAAWFAAASSRDSPCGDQHYCRGEQTCCKAHSGGWACCPYSKGTCCHDRRHCCPPGFYCSRSGFECFRRQPLRWDISIFSPYSAPASPLV